MNQNLTVSTARAAVTLRPEATPEPSCSICLLPTPAGLCLTCEGLCTACHGYGATPTSLTSDPQQHAESHCLDCDGTGLRPNGPTFNDWPAEQELSF